jgi:hypothetical protein
MHRRKIPNRNLWTRRPRRVLNGAGQNDKGYHSRRPSAETVSSLSRVKRDTFTPAEGGKTELRSSENASGSKADEYSGTSIEPCSNFDAFG